MSDNTLSAPPPQAVVSSHYASRPSPDDRPPTPWWAGVLAVLGVLLVVGVLVAAVSGVLYQVATRTTTLPVDETGVRQIQITGVTGGVVISTDRVAAGQVEGQAEVTTSWQQADVTVERDGDVLLLKASCPDQGWPRRCDVGYRLAVDEDIDLVVDLVTGGLQADGLAGDVDASVTTGGVMLNRSSSSRVDVDVTTGGVALDFVEPPTSVRVSTTTGGIGIGVPDDDETYAVRTAVTVGGANVGVPTEPSARRSINATTTVGGIDISHLDPTL